jgi:hypothetical protein
VVVRATHKMIEERFMKNDMNLELPELKVFKTFNWILTECERMRMQVWTQAITERLTAKKTKMLKNTSALEDIDESLPLSSLANVALPSSSSGASSSASVANVGATKSEQKNDRQKASMKATMDKFFEKVPKAVK